MNKKINTNVGITIFFMAAVILVLADFIVLGYELNYVGYDNDSTEDSSTVVEEKCFDSEKTISENSYYIFSNNMKEQVSAKYDSSNMQYEYIESDIVNNGYVVYLNQSGSLFIRYSDESLNMKFGDYKIADNVLSFYLITEGQDSGKNLYFINSDGTVGSADIEYGVVNNGVVNIKSDLGYKNIVSIVQGGFGLEFSGVHSAIFIDINGNMYNNNF